MADPRKKREKRRRELRERQAQERRESDHWEAESLYQWASGALRRNDLAGAARLAKKALALDPDHAASIDLMGQVHFRAGQYADALYYLNLRRKVSGDPFVAYNAGQALLLMGKYARAHQEFETFLRESESRAREPRFAELREFASRRLRELAERMVESEEAARPAVTNDEPESRQAPPAARPTPCVGVQIAIAEAAECQPGALADFFLRRRLLELRQAQSFEDLICLSSLNQVDAYLYQQNTVRKVLRQFKGRALLADEVGLGKTIEACMALKEYWLRGMVKKALVLTPPSLVAQWKGELVEKFGLQPATPDGADYRRSPEEFWGRESLVVASIAMARLEPHASAVAAVPWDMVIVDEAHLLKNRESASWRLVNSLQKRFILMLSATPVENNLLELYNLVSVLKPGLLSTEAEFRKSFLMPGRPRTPRNPEGLRRLLSEVMIRNTRSAADVRLPQRIASSIVVAPSAGERELYNRVSTFVTKKAGNGGGRSIAFSWLMREAGSSPHAVCRSLGRAISEDGWVEAGDHRDVEEIQELAAGIRESGKGEQLAAMLTARAGKKVVFTEFVATLEHVAAICDRHSIRYARFAGDLSRGERDVAIRHFREEADVLLSTGVGGEGCNLQFADTVINFDLPWNPMRLEQRVGRVHRIGQSRDVFVFNFCLAGSIEEQLLRVLHDKINMFELVVGEIGSIIGAGEDGRDFADLILDLWVGSATPEQREQAFNGLAGKLLAAKKHYQQTKELDEALFERDFEV